MKSQVKFKGSSQQPSAKKEGKKKKTLLSNINYLIAALKKEKRKIGPFHMKHMVHSLFLAM